MLQRANLLPKGKFLLKPMFSKDHDSLWLLSFLFLYFSKTLRRIGNYSFWNGFLHFVTNPIYLPDRKPFWFPLSFCLSFGELHLSRNLSISPVLSNSLAQNFHDSLRDFMAEFRQNRLYLKKVFSCGPSIAACPAASWPQHSGSWGVSFSSLDAAFVR